MGDSFLREFQKMLDRGLVLKELNEELADTLETILFWIFKYADKHNIPIREERSLFLLLQRAQNLTDQMKNSLPPTQRYREDSRPEDPTEPRAVSLKN